MKNCCPDCAPDHEIHRLVWRLAFPHRSLGCVRRGGVPSLRFRVCQSLYTRWEGHEGIYARPAWIKMRLQTHLTPQTPPIPPSDISLK